MTANAATGELAIDDAGTDEQKERLPWWAGNGEARHVPRHRRPGKRWLRRGKSA